MLTIGTEEEKLRLVIKIDNLLFDTRGATRNEEINDRLQVKSRLVLEMHYYTWLMTYIDVFFEAYSRLGVEPGRKEN
jgi:hypothetical protein